MDRFLFLTAILTIVGCSAEQSGSLSTISDTSAMGNRNSGGTGGASGASGANGSSYISGYPGSSIPTAGTNQTAPKGQDTAGTGAEVNCGSVKVEADVEIINTGNLLVVFDRSNTMTTLWGNLTRYEAAGQALIAAITPLQDMLTVGGIFFPSYPADMACNVADPFAWIPPTGACINMIIPCEVTDITAADQINFRPAAEFITELPNQWILLGVGMTPIELAVKKADAALSNSSLVGNVAVVIMTDGEPDCGDDINNVNAIVSGWASKGIKTYVVGLPGSTAASTILTQLATSGGTGNYFEPNDPAALQAEFSTISAETVKRGISSCVINLVQTADADIDKLQMIVTENGEERNVLRQMSGGGWSVSPDGKVATMEGSVCEDAKNGRFEAVRFDFGCMDIPILM